MSNNTRRGARRFCHSESPEMRQGGANRLKQAAALLLLFLIFLSMGPGGVLGEGKKHNIMESARKDASADIAFEQENTNLQAPEQSAVNDYRPAAAGRLGALSPAAGGTFSIAGPGGMRAVQPVAGMIGGGEIQRLAASLMAGKNAGQAGAGTAVQEGQAGTEQAGTNQTGTNQTGTNQTGTEQTGTNQTGTNQTGTNQTGTEQTGTNQTGTEQTGTEQAGTEQTGGSPKTAEQNGQGEALLLGGAQQKDTLFVIDGQQLELKDPIRSIEGRTYYPFRACLEAMGAEVTWDGVNQTATGILGTKEVIFAVDSQTFSVNGLASVMPDAKVFLETGINRVYIPIRYAAEALGFTVTWHRGSLYDLVELISPGDLEVVTVTNALSLYGKEIYLDQSLTEVISLLGQPGRIDPSPYGLKWYVYNRSYENFIMVGIHENKVKGFFCNSGNLLLKEGLGYGSTKAEVEKAYGGQETMEFWFDKHNGEKLYAVWCMEQFFSDSEMQLLFDQNPAGLLRAYEQECLDITNAFRVAQGKSPVQYNSLNAEVALTYAKDLAERNFFDHKDPDGNGPMERMVNSGVDVRKVTENLARGYSDAIQVFKAWVDSESHRKGMLEDNVYLGVGAYYKSASRGKYYFVQEFTTPW